MALKRRDPALVDALAARATTRFSSEVYRITREDRDPIRPGRPGGRWDDGGVDVLYTSLSLDGATAEMAYHAARGQPVIPSKPVYRAYRLSIEAEAVLDLSEIGDLKALGLDMGRYGQMSYEGKEGEYPRSQDIGAIAAFLGCSGLLVPSARSTAINLVLMFQAEAYPLVTIVEDLGPVRWTNAANRPRA